MAGDFYKPGQSWNGGESLLVLRLLLPANIGAEREDKWERQELQGRFQEKQQHPSMNKENTFTW